MDGTILFRIIWWVLCMFTAYLAGIRKTLAINMGILKQPSVDAPAIGENMAFQCGLPKTTTCGEQFETGPELNRHKMKEHPEFMKGAVFCEVEGCGDLILATDTTQGAENLRGHMAMHTEAEKAAKTVCPTCGVNYKEAHQAAHQKE